MAKRTPKLAPEKTPPAADTASPTKSSRKSRSGSGSRASRRPDVAAEMAGGQDQAAAMSDQFVGEANHGEEPVQAAGGPAPESIPMSSEPSAEDIRMRAYHRYLERGGGHGMEFDDWVAAEHELKNRR
jgi:Protein of unknown function (DUF2934)